MSTDPHDPAAADTWVFYVNAGGIDMADWTLLRANGVTADAERYDATTDAWVPLGHPVVSRDYDPATATEAHEVIEVKKATRM